MHLASRRRLLACVLALAVVSAVPQPAGAISASRQRALEGSSYVAGEQRANGAICAFSCIGSTADAVTALVAARTAPGVVKDALAYLRRQVERGHVTGLGLRSKVAMAAEAGGANPRAFGGLNLVRSITDSEGVDGHYGDAAVFDQALAMLALQGAGTDPSAAAVSWLEAAQCDDGGWQYDAPPSANDDAHCFDATVPDPGDFFTSDSNTTSLAIQVLRTGTDVDEALAFLPTLRDGTAGWGYSQGYPTDINSTALVIQAYVASGTTVPSGGFATLRTSQLDCGAWPYQPGSGCRRMPRIAPYAGCRTSASTAATASPRPRTSGGTGTATATGAGRGRAAAPPTGPSRPATSRAGSGDPARTATPMQRRPGHARPTCARRRRRRPIRRRSRATTAGVVATGAEARLPRHRR